MRGDPILVTGATGMVGGAVVRRLAELGAPVRALVRDAGKSTGLPTDEIATGDLSDPDSLTEALDGVAAVFLVLPELTAGDTTPSLTSMLAEHAERITYVSARGAAQGEGATAPIAAWHARVESLLNDTGRTCTFLRPAGLARNALGWADQIRAGDTVRELLGDLRRPLVHERDLADVAALTLTEPCHAGVHEISGPEALSAAEQVETIGQVVGRPLRFEDVDEATARRELFADAPPDFVDAIITGSREQLKHPEPVTDTVQRLLGRPAIPFRTWVEDHIDSFRR